MNTSWVRRVAALLLIIVPVVFVGCFVLLQLQFEYPDILRQPTADVLAKFQAGGTGLIGLWYVLMMTALLFVPLVVLLHHGLAEGRASAALSLATTFGLIAGLVQTLGFARWPFLVPHLAAVYADPAASEAERAAAALVFEAFHRYAGMAIGEHLGYLSTSLWSALIALTLVQQRRIPAWLAGLGSLLAAGIATGLLEPAGLEFAGVVNALSYLAWALWLVVVGVWLLRSPRQERATLPAALGSRH